jgi:hypothetical protein
LRIIVRTEAGAETNRTRHRKEPRIARAADAPRADTNKENPMAQKHQRGNREAKKPKQNKNKVVASTSPFAAAHTNPGKSVAAAKRK